jgi:hypothetical protein
VSHGEKVCKSLIFNDLNFDRSFKTFNRAPARFKEPRSYSPEATPVVGSKVSIPLPKNNEKPTLFPSYSQRPNP